MYSVQDQVYPMQPLYGALPVPYVPVRDTHGESVAHSYLFQCRIFITLSVSLWNDLDDPVFDGVRLAGLKSRVTPFLLA